MTSACPQSAIDSLKRFPLMLKSLVHGLSEENLLFRPEDGSWSILEILGHLVDEEKLDFPRRMKLILEGQDWPSIDPVGWAQKHAYQDQRADRQMTEFVKLRSHSIEWLESLEINEALLVTDYDNPNLGPLSFGDLLFAWSAHDLLHVRQISRRLFEWNEKQAGEFQVAYAGSWHPK